MKYQPELQSVATAAHPSFRPFAQIYFMVFVKKIIRSYSKEQASTPHMKK